jgi:L-ascorbate metabolism protein UlaG (beta-lactamase superfamily)
VVHVDPWSKVGDYSMLPKADLILVTHEHGDHLDAKTIESIRKSNTTLIYTAKCNEAQTELKGIVLKNGDHRQVGEIEIEAVPAYNLINKRPDGKAFHPRGEGNGYILTIGGKKIYIAGDTENTPEMKALKNIDVAFLPMNLPYTMTPEMVADAAMAFHPGILYPYHTGETDITKLADLLKASGIDVRYRKMK